LTQQPKENIIPSTRSGAPQGGRHQIGTPAGFGSEQVAGFRLECMAGFVGIRTESPLQAATAKRLQIIAGAR
jgi:hypothetical protein